MIRATHARTHGTHHSRTHARTLMVTQIRSELKSTVRHGHRGERIMLKNLPIMLCCSAPISYLLCSTISLLCSKLWLFYRKFVDMHPRKAIVLRDSLLVQEFRFQRPSSVSQCCLNTVTAKKCPAMFVGGANPG